MKNKIWKIALTVSSFTILMPLALNAEPWNVVLSKGQNQALVELESESGNKSFAISPDGPWGRAWGNKSASQSEKEALAFCREHVRKGQRDCVIHSTNGKNKLAASIDVTRVTQRYKARHGQNAAKFFGLAAIDFQGSRQEALKEFELTQNDGQAWRSIPKDRKLEQQLTERGLISVGKDGWALFLDKVEARHYAKGSPSTFKEWVVSKNGLLCMYFGEFDNGRKRGDVCMLIDSISRGEMRYSWALVNGQSKRAFAVAGNPGRSAVK